MDTQNRTSTRTRIKTCIDFSFLACQFTYAQNRTSTRTRIKTISGDQFPARRSPQNRTSTRTRIKTTRPFINTSAFSESSQNRTSTRTRIKTIAPENVFSNVFDVLRIVLPLEQGLRLAYQIAVGTQQLRTQNRTSTRTRIKTLQGFQLIELAQRLRIVLPLEQGLRPEAP